MKRVTTVAEANIEIKMDNNKLMISFSDDVSLELMFIIKIKLDTKIRFNF